MLKAFSFNNDCLLFYLLMKCIYVHCIQDIQLISLCHSQMLCFPSMFKLMEWLNMQYYITMKSSYPKSNILSYFQIAYRVVDLNKKWLLDEVMRNHQNKSMCHIFLVFNNNHLQLFINAKHIEGSLE